MNYLSAIQFKGTYLINPAHNLHADKVAVAASAFQTLKAEGLNPKALRLDADVVRVNDDKGNDYSEMSPMQRKVLNASKDKFRYHVKTIGTITINSDGRPGTLQFDA